MLNRSRVLTSILALINVKTSTCFKQYTPLTKSSFCADFRCSTLCITNRADYVILSSNKDENLYSAESYKEGEDLARELYELVRIREFKEKLEETEPEMEDVLSEQTKRELNSTPFAGRREVVNGKDISPYTSSSAGLFTQSGKSAYFSKSESNNNAKRTILEQEFGMVDMWTSERSILIQAAVLLTALVFYLYIGFMGGITNGFMEDAIDFDLDIDYEQVESTAQSLWI